MLEVTGHEPRVLLPFLRQSTRRILTTADALDEQAISAPSLLPGWSRAHVLAHIAGSANSRVRLLTAGATGLDIPQYRDERARAEQIEADAGRSRDSLVDLVRQSLTGALTAIRDYPASRWNNEAEWLGGDRHPVHRAVSSLLQELEIHHVDLDAGYNPAHWPGWFVADECRRVLASFVGQQEMPRIRVQAIDQQIKHDFGDKAVVTGTGYALLAWLIGRSRGDGLSIDPPGALPKVPAWKR